jgi:hypothetical protein
MGTGQHIILTADMIERMDELCPDFVLETNPEKENEDEDKEPLKV